MVAGQGCRVLVVVEHLTVPVLARCRTQAMLADGAMRTDRITDPVALKAAVGRYAAPAAFPLVVPPPVTGQLFPLGTDINVSFLIVFKFPAALTSGLPWLGLSLSHEGFHAQGFYPGQVSGIIGFCQGPPPLTTRIG